MEVHDPILNFRIIKNSSVESLPRFFLANQREYGKMQRLNQNFTQTYTMLEFSSFSMSLMITNTKLKIG